MNRCKECGSETSNPVFCSGTCTAIYNNQKYPKRRDGRTYPNCDYCGDLVPRYKRNGKIYCNRECVNAHHKQIIIEKIENNSDRVGHHQYRNYLMKKYGSKCCKCEWSVKNPFSDTIPIVMNHIDGNSDNWVLENLELLCPNCDSLTSTYKALNKGNGRHSRKVRYTEGKSY